MGLWETNPDGTIRTQPIAAWTMALFPMNVMVRLDALTPDNGTQAIQFHMSAAQCREFAEALLKRVEQAEQQMSGAPPQ